MTDGFLQLRIEGPRGTVAKGQVLANLNQLHSSWMPDTMRAAGRYVRQVLLGRQFGVEGAYLGSRWAALSRPYLQWKRDHGFSTRIGVRTGAMVAALTGASVDAFTMDGPMRKLSGRPTKISAKPILDYSASHVTIGADVREDGREYTEHFDRRRPIMGTGRLPSQAEFELGKLLSLPVKLAARTAEFGNPWDSRADFPDAEITRFLSVRALKAAA